MLWKKRVLDLLFPPKCIFCGKMMERGKICPALTVFYDAALFKCVLIKKHL